jgi:hypothetical protein
MRTITAAAALTLAVLASALEPAAAAECRDRVSASSGVRLTGSGEGLTERACARARSKWSALVKERYGGRFDSWSAARERIQAVKNDGGFIRCSAAAIPCEPTMLAPPR